MSYLGYSWIPLFRENYPREIQAYVNCFKENILPTFADVRLDEEAKQIEKREFERLSGLADPEIVDDAEAADKAINFAASHYILMNKIKQGLLNLSVVGLYHLFEQQLFRFHRRVLLKPQEQDDDDLIKVSEVKIRLKNNGINLDDFSSWGDIYDELRYLANSVKHAEGDSSEKLKKRRPDFFEDPDFRELDSKLPSGIRLNSRWVFPLYQPLMGDGIYVSLEAVQSYAEVIISFWLNFANTLEHLSHE